MTINHWSFAALALATAMLFGAPASAQDTGFYVAGDLGYHAPTKIASSVEGTNENWEWGVHNNADGFLRLGYAFDSNWSVELEGGYRPGDLSSIRAGVFLPIPAHIPPGVNLSNVSGDADATTAMANVLYTVPLGLPIQPFIGGGAGLVHTSIKGQGEYGFCDLCLKAQTPICFVCGAQFNANGSSDRFGWQGIAGLSWPIAPRWTLDATYRYVRASGATWVAGGGAGEGLFASDVFHGSYSDNSVTLGIRYDFGGG
jgi:opacity protein-like surface antigen